VVWWEGMKLLRDGYGGSVEVEDMECVDRVGYL
jgi:hypothetical protein